MDPRSVPTREEVLWRVDCILSWDAPNCTVPQALRTPELNMLVGKGAYKMDRPRHFIRVGFELNAPDEGDALHRARTELAQHVETIEQRHHDDDVDLPVGIDLHPDRVVVDRLAARRVVSAPGEDGRPAPA